jgi:hypothetical protein
VVGVEDDVEVVVGVVVVGVTVDEIESVFGAEEEREEADGPEGDVMDGVGTPPPVVVVVKDIVEKKKKRKGF